MHSSSLLFPLLLLALGYLARALLVKFLPVATFKVVIPDFFNLILVHNRGAAFGFLNDPNIDWKLPKSRATENRASDVEAQPVDAA